MANLVLRQTSRSGNVTDIPLDEVADLRVEPNATYTVVDLDTGQPAEGVEVSRDGRDLEIKVDGQTVATIDGFYVDGTMASFESGGD